MQINFRKMCIQSIYQCGCIFYCTASRIHLGVLQRQQNYLIQKVFGLKQTDEVRTYRKNYSIFSIFRFHVSELLRLFCKIVRIEHISLLVNTFISTSEIEGCFYDQRRPKSLTTIYKLTTADKKNRNTDTYIGQLNH